MKKCNGMQFWQSVANDIAAETLNAFIRQLGTIADDWYSVSVCAVGWKGGDVGGPL